MKIVIAPDSFKATLSSIEAANAIRDGFCKVFKDADFSLVPMADGGEGALEVLVSNTNGHFIKASVCGPLSEEIDSKYGVLGNGKTAVIEMAKASGLALLPHEKQNTMLATTYGTGQLIKLALDKGFREFIVTLGGSATSDCGIGALAALGVKFLDDSGQQVPLCGAGLSSIEQIDTYGLDDRALESSFVLACDVDNPLLDSNGAVAVYSEQKGNADLDVLHSGFNNFANKVESLFGKQIDIPGAGAAGGLAAGLISFLNAKVESGGDIIADAVNLKEKINGANLVVTGEGEINEQTIFGKTPICVAKIAGDIPVIAIAANLADGFEKVYEYGIDAAFSIAPGIISKEYSCKNAKQLLISASERMAKTLKIGRNL